MSIMFRCIECDLKTSDITYPFVCRCGLRYTDATTFVKLKTSAPARKPTDKPMTQPIGLGDSIAAFASRFGIPHCNGCEERRVWLNEVIPYRCD